MLDDRRARVLDALIEEYIATGCPVSSQAILERSGLAVSSATIRNDLARLEAYGFVRQPHTSAGRIPTPQGYRYYVDHASPAQLRSTTRVRIEAFFADVHRQLNRLLKETTGLLAEVSHYPSVVVGPGFSGESLVAVHLVPIGSRVVMAVSVSDSGRVSQDVIRLGFTPDDAELAEAEELVMSAFARAAIATGVARIEAMRQEPVPPRVRQLVDAVSSAMQRADHTTKEVYVGGTAQLAELWKDLAQVHAILALLETETALRRLLDDDSESTTVRLANEMDIPTPDLAVVSSPYDAGEHGVGRVGVLGPLRMDYRRAMRIVTEVGESLGDSLGREP